MAQPIRATTRFFAAVCAGGMALLAAGGCGKGESHGAYQREQETREKAATTIEGAGAKMVKKSYPGYGQAWSIDLSGKELNAGIWQQLGALGYITELNLSKTNLTDADMKNVSGLGTVCLRLDLSHTDISDTGLGDLRNLLVLGQLNLVGTKCTQAGVDAFKKRLSESANVRSKNPAVKLK